MPATLIDSNPVELTTSLQSGSVFYQVSAGKIGTLTGIVIHNTDSVARIVEIHAVENGGAAAVKNKIRDQLTIVAGDTEVWSLVGLHLEAGAEIHAKCDANSVVGMRVSAIESPTTAPLVVVPPFTIPSSPAAQYTVSALLSGIMGSMIFCNTDSVARQIEIWFVESGGSRAVKNKFQGPTTTIAAGDTWIWPLNTLLPTGTAIHMGSDAANVIGVRMSLQEF